MDSSGNQYQQPQSESECPQCRKKYSSSGSGSESYSEERIVIPLRRQLLNNSNEQIQMILKNLQNQVQNLKKSNYEKDKLIEDLKRQIDHKMTHYMLKGEINKQADQINRLKSELTHNNNVSFISKAAPEINLNEILSIVREETKKAVTERGYISANHQRHSKRNLKSHTLINSQARKNELAHHTKPKRHTSPDFVTDFQQEYRSSGVFNQYFQPFQNKGVFKIGEAKRKIAELEQKAKLYEQQMLWMTNFVTTFIKTMQNIGYKKYQEQIIIPEWSLKKKAKTSWRYMKHVFKFLLDQGLE